jgi:hypothetical protein
MKKTKVPSPELYSNAKDYFTAFVGINKTESSNFSYRFIAKKLKWPLGYLSDVIAGRKTLTLTRALQFGAAYKLRSVEQERLTWFALVESDNAEVKSFFYKKLHLTPHDVLLPPIVIKDPALYNTLAAVTAFLILTGRRQTATEILAQVSLPYLTEKKVAKALSEIEKNRYLVWGAGGELVENNAHFAFDNYDGRNETPFLNLELHKETTESFLSYIKTPKRPAAYNSGLILVRKDQFMSLALQIISLRNWLVEVSKENIRTATPESAHRLMQFDLNLFPVTELIS